MTEATYRALAEAAFEEIARLSALGVRSEDIVLIATQDVFWAAYVYDLHWCLRHNVRELTVAASFYGHDVGVINERAGTMLTIFRAAIKGLYGFQDMEPRTLMVVDDDNQAKVYAVERPNGQTAQLRDIGFTVSFGYNREAMAASTDTAAETVRDMLVEDPLFISTGGIFKYTEPLFATEYTHQWFPNPSEEGSKAEGAGPADIKLRGKAEVRPDIADLDAFLCSFKVLKSAT